MKTEVSVISLLKLCMKGKTTYQSRNLWPILKIKTEGEIMTFSGQKKKNKTPKKYGSLFFSPQENNARQKYKIAGGIQEHREILKWE